MLWNCICKKIWHGKKICEKIKNPTAVFVMVWCALKCADPRGIMKSLLKVKAVLLNFTAANILYFLRQNIFSDVLLLKTEKWHYLYFDSVELWSVTIEGVCVNSLS